MSFVSSNAVPRPQWRPRDNTTFAQTHTKSKVRNLIISSPRPLYPPALLPPPTRRPASVFSCTTARSTPSLICESSEPDDLGSEDGDLELDFDFDDEYLASPPPPPPSDRYDTRTTMTPGIIAQLAQHRKTLSLRPSTSNRWYYGESSFPRIARYDGRLSISIEERYYTYQTELGIPEPSWKRAFLLGSQSDSVTARHIYAAQVVSKLGLGGTARQINAEVQKLCQTIVFRGGDCHRGSVRTFALFVCALQKAFTRPSIPISSIINFNEVLNHELLGIFVYCWRDSQFINPLCEVGRNVHPARVLRDITICLNMARLLGHLYRLDFVSGDVMIAALHIVATNVRTFQHIEALRDLIVHAGIDLWNTEKGWQADHYTCIKQIIRSVLVGYCKLKDLYPPDGRDIALRSSIDIIKFFNQKVPHRWLRSTLSCDPN